MALKERPAKRAKLLSDDESSASEPGDFSTLKVNEEYAKRFEHNKKREEKHRLEEKYKAVANGASGDEDEESSSDESEDDDAELADVEVDREIENTLQALRSKDPRIYDKDAKFFRDWEGSVGENRTKLKEKPIYLQDYHRQNLMEGYAGEDDGEEEGGVPTYDQEQEGLRKELVGSMHASANPPDDDQDEEDDFLVAKSKPQDAVASLPKKTITERDIATAEADPETYLSNFMAARAWLTNTESAYKPLDEDDTDEEEKAEKFEEAFNLRFENPEHANETLMSYGRDVGKFGVRREDKSARQKAREREKERKEAEKREREEERARLRKLKVEEAEEKVKRIREAAGLRGQDIDLEQWRDIIEGDFEDDEWDREMKRRFGDSYYAEQEGEGDDDADSEDGGAKKRKIKKPKWDDDIDIKDLVPDFKDDEDEKPEFSLSEDDDAEGGAPLSTVDEEGDVDMDVEPTASSSKSRKKSKKDRERAAVEEKRAARKQRKVIEQLVDASLPINHPSLATSSKKQPTVFRYRETSPTSFGLSARDILFADDAQLNTYVGLKKMHAFRDAEKKRKDKKRLSKKARLREWRKETFGSADGPQEQFLPVGDWAEADFGSGAEVMPAKEPRVEKDGVIEGERKKKRKRGGKKKEVDV